MRLSLALFVVFFLCASVIAFDFPVPPESPQMDFGGTSSDSGQINLSDSSLNSSSEKLETSQRINSWRIILLIFVIVILIAVVLFFMIRYLNNKKQGKGYGKD